jgi:hypothetical protein
VAKEIKSFWQMSEEKDYKTKTQDLIKIHVENEN